MKSPFLGSLSIKTFIKKYWNKKPLLIKNAVPQIKEFATFQDFYNLAEDPEFETRMVYESGGDYPWQAKQGPFKKKDYKKNALWTLICHNLDLLNSDFFQLKENIHFIPEWNFDDIMATVSTKGASVGSHIDDYSVFIIQAAGKRRWLLDEKANPEYIPNIDIRLLKNFNPTIEWILEPGDMIYIPPNVAHHGISLENSISYSMGFKSIRYKDLMGQVFNQLDCKLDDLSFHDHKFKTQKDKFIIQDYVVKKINDELLEVFSNKSDFEDALLKYITMPKNEICITNYNEKQILQKLKKGHKLKRNIWTKFVAKELPNKNYKIAVNALIYKIDSKSYKKITHYFNRDADFEFQLKDNNLMKILLPLIKEGAFYFAH